MPLLQVEVGEQAEEGVVEVEGGLVEVVQRRERSKCRGHTSCSTLRTDPRTCRCSPVTS